MADPFSQLVSSSPVPLRLKKRADFLKAAAGRKTHAALFSVQAVSRPGDAFDSSRVGFTVTKKVGGAVERNRIKRRLREVVRQGGGLCLRPMHDYVIIARRGLLSVPFPTIGPALKAAVGAVHAPPRGKKDSRKQERSRAPALS